MRRRYAAIAALAACAALAAAAGLGQQADQARARGAAFGAAIESIQDDLRDQQTEFFAMKNSVGSGVTREGFAEYAESHFAAMEDLVGRYGGLDPPAPFRPAVDLLRLSTESQLAGDREIALWVLTGDGSHDARATSLYQDALDLEASGLRLFADLQSGRAP